MSFCPCARLQAISRPRTRRGSITLCPPIVSSYNIILKDPQQSHGSVEQQVHFSPNFYATSHITYPWIEISPYTLKYYTNKDTSIVCLYVKNTRKKITANDKFLVLYSHGNNEDLGDNFGFLVDFCTQTGNDIISFDYAGFGGSKGSFTERNLQSDAERVLDFIVTSLSIPLTKIILLGSKLGAVSSVSVAIKKSYNSIRGLILISPELNQGCINNISLIECSVFVIHGLRDNEFPQSASIELGKNIKNFWSWYPSNGTHDNILTTYRNKFYKKIHLFFDVLLGNEAGLGEESISSIDGRQIGGGFNVRKGKQKKIETIPNYLATSSSNKTPGQKQPSVRMYVMEDSTPQQSISSKKIHNEDEEEQIFELNPESLNIGNNLDH